MAHYQLYRTHHLTAENLTSGNERNIDIRIHTYMYDSNIIFVSAFIEVRVNDDFGAIQLFSLLVA